MNTNNPVRNRALIIAAVVLSACVAKGHVSNRPSEPSPDSQDWRRLQPGPGGIEPLRPPVVEKRILKNGVAAYVVARPSLPLVSVRLVLLTGASSDPPDKQGLSRLTLTALAKGPPGTGSARDLASNLGELGATLETDTEFNSSSLTLSAPRETCAAALKLLLAALSEASLTPANIDVARNELRSELDDLAGSGRDLARQAAKAIFYGKQHPMARLTAGMKDGLGAITEADVRKQFQTAVNVRRMFVVVAGDAPLDVVAAELEAGLPSGPDGSATSTADLERKVDAAYAPAGPNIYIVDGPTQGSASLYAVAVVPGPASNEWYAVEVLNQILGGSFSSRLNLELREHRGLTYSIRSRLSPHRTWAELSLRAELDPSRVGEGLEALTAEFAKLAVAAPDEGEVLRAKNAIIVDLALSLQRNSEVVATLADFVVNRGTESFSRELAGVAAIGAHELPASAAKYFRAERFVFAIYGPASSLRPQLEAAGFDKIAVIAPPSF